MSITVEGAAQIRARFELVANDQTKRRVLARIANQVVSNSKKRIQAQSDLNESAWAPRKSGKKKRMLTKLSPLIKVTGANAKEAVIGFYSPIAGKIAAKQQFGNTQMMTAAQADKESINKARQAEIRRQKSVRRSSSSVNAAALDAQTDLAATSIQAAELLKAGFKIRLPNGRSKTPTKKWITQNMFMKQAGAILRAIRGPRPQQWSITLPPRSFLGVTSAELPELNDIALNEMKTAIGI